MPTALATAFPLVNCHGRRYRYDRMPFSFNPTRCAFCGTEDINPDANWLIPATEGGEAFCSVVCLDTDTHHCWDHNPDEGDLPEPTETPAPEWHPSTFEHNDKHDEVDDTWFDVEPPEFVEDDPEFPRGTHVRVDGNAGNAYWVIRANADQVVVRMVQDDRDQTVDRGDVSPIDRDAFCGQCGAIGCAHDGAERT